VSTRYDDEVYPVERTRPAEAVGGFLAAASIAISLVGIVHKPVRLLPFALVIAFVAVGLARERHAKLAVAAVVVGGIAWVVGMTVAVLTGRALY
jgi:hypothetical protein